MANYGVVLVTAGSEEEALAIADDLVQAQVAACVNVSPIQSVYIWQGQVQREPEWQLVIKTDLAQFESLSDRIVAQHSYEVPEIVALPIVQGTDAYLSWLGQQSRGGG